MENYDLKKERRDLYAPGARAFAQVVVPPMSFLQISGEGNPNTAPAYRLAIETLYMTSYAVRALAKAELGRTHTVAPLEGLWTADDYTAFTTRDKDVWRWTMMIAQPEWITPGMVAEARARAAAKGAPAIDRLTFAEYDEGLSVQILHIGSYDDEAPTLERLHNEYIPAAGLRMTGPHHEIYLSDARKTAPEKLRTILRQPVAPA